jgi:hypothetical protein
VRVICLPAKIDNRYNGWDVVVGYAFEIPGREWFHCFAHKQADRLFGSDPYTPGNGWQVSHWETGFSIGPKSHADTKREAIVKTVAFLQSKTDEEIRAKVRKALKQQRGRK